ncbi:S41 family peptidase [Clostridium botulinum]|uniref:S41 family peptidase n=1 Tax=Clostridium botulinum TaxID=1491 RepID=UPI0004D5AED8|nr:S41 family peptidase [Clostridium botulinum]KEI06911.1 peptidase S41 [Clostridium botulinum C/D str. BKT75002]KEI08207.1 peptidase S41 [Clostridium botulinum C/D str. BKT2873]KOC47999.1 peptidase S41 [Clostridium botulinum]MCD3350827.1 S41 family peptidase [Clostridium botulinum D/C]MCD3359848.1 S41 family peptidase [Clostridium botulinum D/C]
MEQRDGNDNERGVKNSSNRRIWWLIVALILILTNFITYILGARLPIKGTRRISERTYEEVMKFEKLFIVKSNLERFYDGKINEKDLIDGAVKGMADSLKDPYTVYMNEKEYKNFSTQTGGNYVGLGIQIGVKNDKVVVVSTFDDSPAKKAGILTKDIIEKVDGERVIGKEYDKAVNRMKGKKGSYVTLTITREGKGTFDVKIKREEIILTSSKGEMVGNNIGYVQISVFDEHTFDQFKNAVNNLKKNGMKGMILDLRQNPGGWLTQAVDITSQFVPKNKVLVSTEDKYKNKEEYKSKGGDLIGMPLVVLIDGGTASASEVFSGAIRDYGMGTLIGENSFGKGIVQSVLYERKFGFGDGTALKVTTSKYYTPKGENIHHKGIRPDIEIKYPEELLRKPYERKNDPQFNRALEVITQKIK